jgi:hypothetical protein
MFKMYFAPELYNAKLRCGSHTIVLETNTICNPSIASSAAQLGSVRDC